MSTYTKIPSSTLGVTLSKITGIAVGKLLSSASSSIRNYYTKAIADLEKEITESTLTGSEIEQRILDLRTSLEQLRLQIRNVQNTLTTLTTTAALLKSSLIALEAAIAVIKVIPIPQVSLVVSVTVIFSDTLETLSELVSQFKEIANALIGVSSVSLQILSPVLSGVENILRILDLLTIAGSTQDTIDYLEYSKEVLTGTYTDYGLRTADIPTTVLSVEILAAVSEERYGIQELNKILNNADWSRINGIENLTGNVPADRALLEKYCKLSKNDISIERVFEYVQNVDRLYELLECNNDGSYSIQKVKKLLESARNSEQNTEKLEQINHNLDNLEKIGIVDENGKLLPFMQLVGKLSIDSTLEDSSKIYEKGLTFLDKLEYSGIGNSVRSKLEATLEKSVTDDNIQQNNIKYLTGTGQILTLRIVVDSKSPKIARSRYVTAEDETGTIVYTGTKSFTTDDSVLIEEAKVRLFQLFS